MKIKKMLEIIIKYITKSFHSIIKIKINVTIIIIIIENTIDTA